MKYIRRDVEDKFKSKVVPNKVVTLIGPRRVGKTKLLKNFLANYQGNYKFVNADDFRAREFLSLESVEHYKQNIGNADLLAIDEAQNIKNIGQIAKLMIDEIPDLKIILTGSSALGIMDDTGEPLTGRASTFNLYPFTENEAEADKDPISKKDRLMQRLIFGNYPEVHQFIGNEDKTEYLRELVTSYLLKDILSYEGIRNSNKIYSLLKMVAFQIGSEVAFDELGKKLSMSNSTVENYLDLLEKTFVIKRITAYSNNLRKEITKKSKWYFLDTGIRNTVIANLNPPTLRNDMGTLWENYILMERLKRISYDRKHAYCYFWRTYDKQEIDWIEERDGSLYAYEFKLNPKRVKVPPAWINAYPDSNFSQINIENYHDFVKPGAFPSLDELQLH